MTLAVSTKGVIGMPRKRTYHAGAASMTRGLAVVDVTDDEHVAIAGANVAVLGFIEESTVSAEDPISITEDGEFIAKIGAAVTIGQFLKTDSSGRVVPTVSAGDNIVAQALSSGSNANDYILAQVCTAATVAQSPTTYYVASGAIAVAPGVADLGTGSALAMTLAAPSTPAQDGIKVVIRASTAHAHVVLTPANKIVITNATYDTATFAYVGDMIELMAVGGVWQLIAKQGVTLTEA